jgi:hypothetical protein
MTGITDLITALNEAGSSPWAWILVPMILAVFSKVYLFKGWGAALRGVTKNIIDRYFNEKHQQIEIQIELEFQIKNLLQAQTALTSHLNALTENKAHLETFLKDMAAKFEFIAEGFWEYRRTLNAQFERFDALWQQIGIATAEKPTQEEPHDGHERRPLGSH